MGIVTSFGVFADQAALNLYLQSNPQLAYNLWNQGYMTLAEYQKAMSAPGVMTGNVTAIPDQPTVEDVISIQQDAKKAYLAGKINMHQLGEIMSQPLSAPVEPPAIPPAPSVAAVASAVPVKAAGMGIAAFAVLLVVGYVVLKALKVIK